MQRIVVVLPAPFGPRKPVTLPGSMPNDRLSTAILSPYRFVRPCTSIIRNQVLSREPSRADVVRSCHEPLHRMKRLGSDVPILPATGRRRVTPRDDLRYSLRVTTLPAPTVAAGQSLPCAS